MYILLQILTSLLISKKVLAGRRFFPTRLARYTLNIDKQLNAFLSEQLGTVTFDYFEYTVIDQMIIRSYNNGELMDLYHTPGDGEIEDATGYFDKLHDYKYKELNEDEIEEKSNLISGFNREMGFSTFFPNSSDENSRRPMYLKGGQADILSFLVSKKDDFYYLY